MWTVTSALWNCGLWIRVSSLVSLSSKRRDRRVGSGRARGKTEVKMIGLRGEGVTFQDAWSAAAVSQSALGNVQRQHHFRSRFQFKRMPGSQKVRRGKMECGDCHGRVLGNDEQSIAGRVGQSGPANVFFVAVFLRFGVRDILGIHLAGPNANIRAVLPVGIIFVWPSAIPTEML